MSMHPPEYPPLKVVRRTTVFSVGLGGDIVGDLSESNDHAWPLVIPINSAICPNDAPLLRCAAAVACSSCLDECCMSPRVAGRWLTNAAGNGICLVGPGGTGQGTVWVGVERLLVAQISTDEAWQHVVVAVKRLVF